MSFRRSIVAALVALLPLVAHADPDFTDVNDILGGRRHILRVDDLIVGTTASPGVDLQQNYTLTFPTTSSTVGNFTLGTFPGGGTTSSGAGPFQTTVIGPVFALPNDVTVTIALLGTPPVPAVQLTDVLGNTTFAGTIRTSLTSVPSINAAILADLDGDGYQDVVVSYGNVLRVGRATDLGDVTQGITWGPELTTPNPIMAIAAGDFDGDNAYELVAALNTTLPNDTTAFVLQFYTVDGATQAINQATTYTTAFTQAIAGASLATGSFDNTPNTTEILLAVNIGTLVSFTVSATLEPTQVDSFDLGQEGQLIQVTSGRFDWLDPGLDQVVLLQQGTLQNAIAIVTFDDDANITVATANDRACTQCLVGVAVGNFDDESSPDLEIAVLVQDPDSANGPAFSIELYQVDTGTFAMTLVDDVNVALVDQGVIGTAAGWSLAAGDTQGRSLRLGAPTKIEVSNHAQPVVILGMPPMHVDGVLLPGAGKKKPKLGPLNVSGVPNGFFARYVTAVTNQNQSQQASTTSYTYGTSSSSTASESVSNLLPGTLSFSASVQSTVTDVYQHVVSDQYNVYTGQAFDASTTTGFDDAVWFTQSRFNLYVYPVLGHTGCPDAMPSCDTSQRQPAYVIFSGPDSVQQLQIDGANLEWFHPLNEPGNALTYPWDYTQLGAVFDGFSPLSQVPPSLFFTDTQTQQESAQWSQGGGSSQTSGASQTHSYSHTESVSGSLVFGGGGSWSYGKSTAFSTLNASINTVGESTGIGIVKPGTFLNPPQYEYAVGAVIFGQDDPAGVTQDISLNTQVQTTGALRTLFVADPGNLSAGEWWRQTYTLPDVALNHPVRWALSTGTGTTTPANCLRFNPSSPTFDCLTFNEPDTSDLPKSEFHQMKGLFVTAGDANGQGPQVTTVTADQGLSLTARIYNLSLADMPANTVVHVRFYGQEFDNSTGTFAAGTQSFLIDEVMIDAIPGFHSSDDPTQVNRATATTTLDTSTYGDTYLVFWVVTWMENPAGTMVTEMPGHGLKNIPTAATSLAKMPIEEFSNNVGLFNQPIYILPAASTATATASVHAATAPTLTRFHLQKPRMRTGKKSLVTVAVENGPTAEQHLQVLFWEQDPSGNVRLFDIEHLPFLRPNDVFTSRVNYRPKTCGTHLLWAELQGATQSTTTMERVKVKCAKGVKPLLVASNPR